MPAQGFRSAFDHRNRLMSLVQSHPLFARATPPLAGQFPRDILPYDPLTVDQAEDIQVCMVVPGQILDNYSLGGAGVGKLTIVASIVILVYVANTPRDTTSPEDWLTQKLQRETLLGQLTNTLLQAVFSFPVDPTPGNQLWNVLKMAPTALGLHTTFYSTDVFHQSKTRVHLTGQMYRPGSPSGTLSPTP